MVEILFYLLFQGTKVITHLKVFPAKTFDGGLQSFDHLLPGLYFDPTTSI